MPLVNMLGDLALDSTVALGHELYLAEREIANTYGDTVSVIEKKKTLIKFGRNDDIDTAIEETVWQPGGLEVYQTANTIDTISSSDAGDTQEMVIEGHTVSGTGVNAQFTFVTQTVTLNGQNKVTLPTPLARCSRAFNNNGVELAGSVYVYRDTAITGGVPNDLTTVHAQVPIGFNQTFKGATTFSNTDYFIMTGAMFSVNRTSTAANVDFIIEVREPGKVFRPVFGRVTVSNTTGTSRIQLDPAVLVPKNSDIRVQAIANTNNVPVTAEFAGYIAQVVV